MLFQLPRECRTFAAINPAAQWGWLEMFANKANYLLELSLWQNTQVKKGQVASHNRRKPKPFIPEFMKAKEPEGELNKGTEPLSLDDVKSWLNTERGV